VRTITLPTNPSRQEQSSINLPIRGPFVRISQFEPVDYKMSWQDFLWKYKDYVTDVFDLEFTETCYQEGPSHTISIAGYYWDTSG